MEEGLEDEGVVAGEEVGFEGWAEFEVFGDVFFHNFAELLKRVWGLGLVVNRDLSVVGEVDLVDGEEVLCLVVG